MQGRQKIVSLTSKSKREWLECILTTEFERKGVRGKGRIRIREFEMAYKGTATLC